MRRPASLFRELGPVGFISFQVLFVGMIAGSVMHTIFAAYVAIGLWKLATASAPTLQFDWLLLVDVFNIVAAWLVFAQLASRVVVPRERPSLALGIWTIWGYWLLVSVAGLRAILQLFRTPHHWEKTPHAEAERAPIAPPAGTTAPAYAGRRRAA